MFSFFTRKTSGFPPTGNGKMLADLPTLPVIASDGKSVFLGRMRSQPTGGQEYPRNPIYSEKCLLALLRSASNRL